MNSKILLLALFLSLPFITYSANYKDFSQAFLDIQWNQVVFNNNTKISKVTTLGNISPNSSEKECLNYLKNKDYKKTCISYQIIVPNYNNKFWIFIKTELGAQELIWKNVFKYDFTTKQITNVKNLLPQDLQNAINFYMWYGSGKIGYTIWDYPTYTPPKEISPSIFDK